jgi:hypothetical protein
MRAALGVALLALGTLVGAGSALADEEDMCAVGDQLAQADFALPQVAAAIQQKHLDIAVVGSGSSSLGGPGGANKAYPARLEAALSQALPDVAVKVVTYIKPRQTSEEMIKQFDQIVSDAKPALIVWQTGTVEAIEGIDADEFRTALDEGVEALRAKHVDIVFMNMQYSPRTEPVIAIDTYADVMRFVALQHEVLLFDRFAIMRHWSEVGTFDLFAATKKTDTAEHVHECIGSLLGRLILQAERMTETSGKEVR